jgi:hypothetical protein
MDKVNKNYISAKKKKKELYFYFSYTVFTKFKQISDSV